jgi:kynureninase
MTPTRADAEAMDAADPLAVFRDAFELPEGVIYLDGNSLGPPARGVAERIADVVAREWGQDLIRSWNANGWMEAPLRVGAKIAPLIGAKPHEVVVADSTTVNLFKLAAGALSLRPARRVILTPEDNFPTDLYAFSGLGELLPGVEARAVPPEQLLGAIDADTAVVALTQAHYKTSFRWDLAEVTSAAHAKGALALFDLSHSAGALAIDLNAARADLATGCGYKYLNGGPGAPAYVFVAERHHRAIRSPITGWMGHAAPFEFGPDYRPDPGIRAMVSGTPGILGLAALEASLEVIAAAGPARLEAKGLALAELFIRLVETRCAGHGLSLLGPREMNRRGLHVSFAHPEGYALVQALIARGVIGDFRAPDVARFGFSPLILSFADVWDAAEILGEVLDTRAYDRPEHRERATVT